MSTDKTPPRLSLEPPPSLRRVAGASRTATSLLLLLLVLQVAVLWHLFGAEGSSGARSAEDSGRLREIALALEDRSLPREAARKWERHAELSPEDPDLPQVLYRAGNLRMEAGDWSQAAGHFVAAELAARRGGSDVPAPLGQKLVECLRRLGLYGEVGRELSRQVDASGEGEASPVLATYAGEAITTADLDRLVERQVERVLEMQGGGSEETRQRILKQLQSEEARGGLLREFLQTELLARRARELELDDSESFRDRLRSAEQELLAAELMKRELGSVRATDVDLESYFQAHQGDYQRPAETEVLVLELRGGEDAGEVLGSVEGGEAFRQAAADRAPGGQAERRRLFAGRPDELLGADLDGVLALDPGQWTEREIQYSGRRFLVLVEQRQEASPGDYEEVREQVAADYSERKGREITEQLLRDLMARYELEILESGAAAEAPR